MNWRSGFKRIEIVYALAALLFGLSNAFDAGGGWHGHSVAWNVLTYPNDTWRVHYVGTSETTQLTNIPHGMTEEWVRTEWARTQPAAEVERFQLEQEFYFRWGEALATLLEILLIALGAWLAVKVLLWIYRGFRQPHA